MLEPSSLHQLPQKLKEVHEALQGYEVNDSTDSFLIVNHASNNNIIFSTASILQYLQKTLRVAKVVTTQNSKKIATYK